MSTIVKFKNEILYTASPGRNQTRRGEDDYTYRVGHINSAGRTILSVPSGVDCFANISWYNNQEFFNPLEITTDLEKLHALWDGKSIQNLFGRNFKYPDFNDFSRSEADLRISDFREHGGTESGSRKHEAESVVQQNAYLGSKNIFETVTRVSDTKESPLLIKLLQATTSHYRHASSAANW